MLVAVRTSSRELYTHCAASLALIAFGSSARSLYHHFADRVSGFHGKLVQAVQEGVAWPHQPEISADPFLGSVPAGLSSPFLPRSVDGSPGTVPYTSARVPFADGVLCNNNNIPGRGLPLPGMFKGHKGVRRLI